MLRLHNNSYRGTKTNTNEKNKNKFKLQLQLKVLSHKQTLQHDV